MPYPFVTQDDVEDRMGRRTVQRILDDDRTGEASLDAVNRLIKDASSRVAGALRPMYSLTTIKAMTADDLPEEIKRLTLDGVVAYAAQRHPEAVKRDWVPLWGAWSDELKALRKGEVRLDVEGSPEPAENAGGDFTVGDPDTYDEDTFEPTFAWGTSDF